MRFPAHKLCDPQLNTALHVGEACVCLLHHLEREQPHVLLGGFAATAGGQGGSGQSSPRLLEELRVRGASWEGVLLSHGTVWMLAFWSS